MKRGQDDDEQTPCVSLVVVMVSGCELTPSQPAIVEREPGVGEGVHVTGPSVGHNGVTCRYSDGSVGRSQNMAATCL